MKRKDILGIKDLSKSEITEILQTANGFRSVIDGKERRTHLCQRMRLYILQA